MSAMEVAGQPTQKVKYLGLRQRLKDSIRRKSKQSTAGISSQEKEKRLPYNNFGSFFGPSQLIISKKVIQESKSLLENQDLVSKMLSTRQSTKKKVEKLKVARDYSFLSDDAKVSAPAKESPPPNVSASQLAHVNKPVRQVSSHPTMSNVQRHKKKQLNELEEARMIIRKMFQTDRYPVCDDDISEANFEDCMGEERKSAKIGRKEDEQQLNLIEEENRRKRTRRLAKRCKLNSKE